MKELKLPFKVPARARRNSPAVKQSSPTPAVKPSRTLPRSQHEEKLAVHIRVAQLPEPQREYRFDAERRWRLDFAWPEFKIGCEVEGGTWIQGRHQRGAGFQSDAEKYNTLIVGGWRCLRFTPQMVRDGSAIRTLERLLASPLKPNN
jgi:very-short-patch-repair endonuclease